MKKILYFTRPLCEPWDEASKNFAHDLACAVPNHQITVLTCDTIDDLPENVHPVQIYTNRHFTIVQKVRALIYLAKNAESFDVVHLLFTPSRLTSFILRSLLLGKVKTVQTIATIRNDLFTPVTYKKVFFADELVTYSAYAAQTLVDAGFKNVHHIYPGINLKRFAPAPKNPALLTRFGLTTNDTIVTYPGEFARLGATDLIVRSFISMWSNPENHHVKYLCACRLKNNADIKKKNEVIARLEAAGHRDKVIFTDTFADMNGIYNISDIVLFPVGNLDGKFDVPLALIEPYACKKAVIVTDLPKLKEFSSSAINAIIPPDNSDELYLTILALAADERRRERLGTEAHTFVHTTFNISTSGAAYTNLYDKL